MDVYLCASNTNLVFAFCSSVVATEKRIVVAPVIEIILHYDALVVFDIDGAPHTQQEVE